MNANDLKGKSGNESHLGHSRPPPFLGLIILVPHLLGKAIGWWKIAEPIGSYLRGGISRTEEMHGVCELPFVNQTTG
jgi:hypothetical protein